MINFGRFIIIYFLSFVHFSAELNRFKQRVIWEFVSSLMCCVDARDTLNDGVVHYRGTLAPAVQRGVAKKNNNVEPDETELSKNWIRIHPITGVI